MTAAQDVSWINKPKRVFIEASPAQGDLPVRSNRIIVDLKPAYIAEMELLPSIPHVAPINPLRASHPDPYQPPDVLNSDSFDSHSWGLRVVRDRPDAMEFELDDEYESWFYDQV